MIKNKDGKTDFSTGMFIVIFWSVIILGASGTDAFQNGADCHFLIGKFCFIWSNSTSVTSSSLSTSTQYNNDFDNLNYNNISKEPICTGNLCDGTCFELCTPSKVFRCKNGGGWCVDSDAVWCNEKYHKNCDEGIFSCESTGAICIKPKTTETNFAFVDHNYNHINYNSDNCYGTCWDLVDECEENCEDILDDDDFFDCDDECDELEDECEDKCDNTIVYELTNTNSGTCSGNLCGDSCFNLCSASKIFRCRDGEGYCVDDDARWCNDKYYAACDGGTFTCTDLGASCKTTSYTYTQENGKIIYLPIGKGENCHIQSNGKLICYPT